LLSVATSRRTRTAVELPTLGVALAVHGGWLLLTAVSASVPWWLLAPLGGFLVAWHGSFQHETIHGHPTRSRAINTALGSLPLGLWLPYGIYRDQHLAHHGVDELTRPHEDPESCYVTSDEWAASGAARRVWLRAQTTLLGRLVLGPPAVVWRFVASELRLLLAGDRRNVRAWALHLAGVALVVAWLVMVCHLSIARYLFCFVYPGMALMLLRSFAEHRPAAVAAERVGIVEAGPLASLLYLNNNLHVLHHDAPALPWYELPARYRATRARVLEANGNFVFAGYLPLIARYALRSKDSPVHPAG
jgi:fatty acid desaturase